MQNSIIGLMYLEKKVSARYTEKNGAESISILQQAIAALGDDTTSNYWDATEGNAKRPLYQLLAMAQMRPDGIWDGD